jgi:hypothetical protein
MKTNKLLIAAVLAIAIGVPIVGFVGDINMAQPTTPAGERVAFFHGLADGTAANQSGLASLERADAWLNSPPLSALAPRSSAAPSSERRARRISHASTDHQSLPP